MRLLTLLLFGFLLSCSGGKVSRSSEFSVCVFKKYQEGFVLSLPSDWTYIERDGIDSYIGQINAPTNDTLYFSFGIYSLSDRPTIRGDEDEDEYRKKVHYETLSGYKARIVTHSKGDFSDFAIHFDSLWVVQEHERFSDIQKLTIYGANLSKLTRNTVLKAVKNVRFIRDSTAANMGLMQPGPKLQ
jgi:hypothetical protein